MALFNKNMKEAQMTINRARGQAYVMTAEMQLDTILLTSFAQNQFYRKTENTFLELRKLLAAVSPEFAAKAAIYARTEFGMRSITHVLAAEIAGY